LIEASFVLNAFLLCFFYGGPIIRSHYLPH
jgi:hypothetical protein